MSWEETEDALQEAIARASGYSSDRVIWKHQNKGAPPLDYIALSLGGALQVGQDYIKETQDLTKPNGQEIKLEVKGLRELALEIEVFTSSVTKEASARAIAERTRSALLLPTIEWILDDVGVSAFDTTGLVNWIPDLPAAKFRGRAHVTIRLYMPLQDIVEYCGYIASVQGETTIEGASSGEKIIAWKVPPDPPDPPPVPPVSPYRLAVLARNPAHFWMLNHAGGFPPGNDPDLGSDPVDLVPSGFPSLSVGIVPFDAGALSTRCLDTDAYGNGITYGDYDSFTLRCWISPRTTLGQHRGGWDNWELDSLGRVLAGDAINGLPITSGYAVSVGEAVNIALTFDGGTLSLYINGELEGSADVSGTGVSRGGFSSFEVNSGGGSTFYQQLSYETVCLTPEEIRADYRSTQAPY